MGRIQGPTTQLLLVEIKELLVLLKVIEQIWGQVQHRPEGIEWAWLPLQLRFKEEVQRVEFWVRVLMEWFLRRAWTRGDFSMVVVLQVDMVSR